MNMKSIVFSIMMMVGWCLYGKSNELKLSKYKEVKQTITRVRVASASVLPDQWDKAANWKRMGN